MAITIPQIQGAQQSSQTLLTQVQQMIGFLNQILQIANNGWQITHTVGGVDVTIVVDATTQANILAAYNTLKSNLATTYGQLP